MTTLAATGTGVLAARGIVKRFAGVAALDGVDLTLEPGRIHALVGENGAGKSTLSKILSGFETADAGEVLVEGEPVRFNGPSGAAARGIAIVHQELSVIRSLSVAENVLVGSEPSRFGFVDRRRLAREAAGYLEKVGLDVDPRTPASRLSVAQQQLVEIARALAMDAKVIFFDEPTSSLPHRDSRRLLGLLRELRDAGRAIVLISHDLAEVLEIADTVTVLRDGRHIVTAPAGELDEERLIQHMIGRDLEVVYSDHAAAAASGPPALVVEDLAAPGVRAASLSVRAGEVLGIGGLVGSGGSELLAAIFGHTRPVAGRMLLDGRPYRPRHPADALARGVGLVPESRKDQGLQLGLSMAANIELSSLSSIATGPWVRRARGRRLVERYIADLRIKTAGPSAPVSTLSGGNQQKVVLAKVLATRPRVLLLDEPTRGIDVGAKAEVHRIIRRLADEGMAIVMVSSVLPELLNASDRIVVMRAGRTVGELSRAEATEESVMRLAFQG